MKLPEKPPSAIGLLKKAMSEFQAGDRKLFSAISAARDPAPDGRYRHWDKLRRLTPPEGLTHEQWWTAIKLSRNSVVQPLPLKDRGGHPFKYGMPGIALALLYQIDREAQGQLTFQPLGADRSYLAEDKSYLVSSLVEEAITSSQLEGASTTRRVAKEMIRSGRPPKDNSERMILNNYKGMNHVRELAERPLRANDIFDLHRILTDGTLETLDGAGRLRRSDEDIVIGDGDGQVVHTPPDASELKNRMAAMCNFANADHPFIHPAVRSILLHFWLAYDHPFVDGNGRTARALFYWSMLRHGYWLSEYLSISKILRKAPSKYARSFLYTETDENDTTYFILAQLSVIQQAIRDLNTHLEKKLDERRSTEALLKRSSAVNHRQLGLLAHALKHPGWDYTIEGHANSHRIVYETARSDLLGLEKKNILTKRRQGKAYVFSAPPDLVARLKRL
jgi:Fic family protein